MGGIRPRRLLSPLSLFLVYLVALFVQQTSAASCSTKNAKPDDRFMLFVASGRPISQAQLDANLQYVLSAPSPDAEVECAADEGCVTHRDLKNATVPYCLRDMAFTFHDAAGTSGSLRDGTYTLPDGRKGNLVTGPLPAAGGGTATLAPPDTTTASTTASTSAASKTTAQGTGAKTGGGGGAGTGAGAKATSTAGSGKIREDGANGLSLLALGGAIVGLAL